jgi:membrane associated rhomboid family serine protease
MSLKNDIIDLFKDGSLLNRLIVINLTVFVVVNLLNVISTLCGLPSGERYLMLPLSPGVLLVRPWTLLTYMFVQTQFVHLIFNLLVLYWFGKLFLLFFSQKDLVGVYVFGGLVGGLFSMTLYNLIPYYSQRIYTAESYLLGASAAVMAIVVATAVMSPDYRLRLVLIGEVKISWLALAYVLLSLLQIVSSNAVGELSHLGGALAGFLFTYCYKKGTNIVSWVGAILDWFSNLMKGNWSSNPKMKVTYGDVRNQTDYQYNASKKAHEENVDRILEKIKQSGYDSLSEEERKELFKK